MGKTDPIGIFDSGVGGLTVVKALLDKIPEESFIYFGDTANVPYGSKNEAQLMGYARSIIAFLMERRVKAIIVACGTHSSVTLPKIIDQYSLPLRGVVKAGARTATRTTCNGQIGILATQATVKSLAYTRSIQEINASFRVYETACPRFVPLVEGGKLDDTETRDAVREYVGPLMDRGIDTLVMGCTHYPFLAPVIREFAGPNLNLVDPACETIIEVRELLQKNSLLNSGAPVHDNEFFVSGNDESFYKVGAHLIGNAMQTVKKITLE